MSDSHVVVNGSDLPPGVPDTPPRRNIADLINDDQQWSLYIQALIELQETDPSDPLSWYEVGSIHGWPLDLQWQNGGSKTEAYGYCTHSDPRFPTWHRPYVALYDQALQAAAVRVAARYTSNQDDWGRAAYTLRSPYWDWADPKTYLPPPQVYDSNNYPTLNITTPNGKQDVPNPLLAYRFQVQIAWDYSQYPTTVRHPEVEDSIGQFKTEVGDQARTGNLQLTYWKTLNWLTNWREFSDDRAVPGQRANSLETLHDWIHDRTGGAGHMGNPISAAYDPLFMLHHTNVDRSLALYQALHPEVWIDAADAQKDLTPFWASQSQFHRSSDEPVRKFTEFKATYPEFVGLENATEAQRKQAIQQKVNALYNPQGVRPGLSIFPSFLRGGVHPAATPAAPSHNAHVVSSLKAAPPPARPAQVPAQVAPTDEARMEWFVCIRAKKFQLKKTFKVLVFLGDVPDDPKKWISSPSFVGSHSVFVNSSPESCGSCKEHSDLITEGFIVLNNALRKQGYEHKTEAEVEKYIHDHIHWRIQKSDGTVVAASDLEVLEVTVITFDLTHHDVHAPLVVHDITSHKDGGYNPSHKPYHL